MADEMVSLEQKVLDGRRFANRAILTLPVFFLILVVLWFLFAGKSIDWIDSDTVGGRLIILAFILALIGGSYLLTGLMIPKQTAK